MGLFDFVGELFFSKPDAPKADWDEIRKLMEFGIEKNRYDQNNLFTSFNWDEDKENMTQSVNSNIEPGFMQMLTRINEGRPGYDRAGAQRGFVNNYEQQRDQLGYAPRGGPPRPGPNQFNGAPGTYENIYDNVNRRALTPEYAQNLLKAMPKYGTYANLNSGNSGSAFDAYRRSV